MSEEPEVVERIHSGVSITADLKRGTATRDQDKLKIKGKGADAAEAIEDFEATLAAAEEREWADRLRAIQPEVSD